MKSIYILIISGRVLLRMRNFSDKSCTENQNTHFVLRNFILFFVFVLENRAIYEIKLKKFVEQGRSRMTKWRRLIACWIRKATNTHSQYATLTAFPLQQWLQKHAQMLCVYVHFLSYCYQENVLTHLHAFGFSFKVTHSVIPQFSRQALVNI